MEPVKVSRAVASNLDYLLKENNYEPHRVYKQAVTDRFNSWFKPLLEFASKSPDKLWTALTVGYVSEATAKESFIDYINRMEQKERRIVLNTFEQLSKIKGYEAVLDVLRKDG